MGVIGSMLIGLAASGGCSDATPLTLERTVEADAGRGVIFSESFRLDEPSVIRFDVVLASGGEINAAIIDKEGYHADERSTPIERAMRVRSAHLQHYAESGAFELIVTPVNTDSDHRVEVRIEIEPAPDAG